VVLNLTPLTLSPESDWPDQKSSDEDKRNEILHQRDVGLIQRAAEDCGVRFPDTSTIQGYFRIALARGWFNSEEILSIAEICPTITQAIKLHCNLGRLSNEDLRNLNVGYSAVVISLQRVYFNHSGEGK